MKKVYLVFVFVLLSQLILAFICGPNSCEWGNTVYFYSGIAALIFAFLLPLLQKSWPTGRRIGMAFLFLFGSVVVWCAGFMLADFNIICRLF